MSSQESALPAQGEANSACSSDPESALEQMFVEIVGGRRICLGQRPAKRPVFLKPHGIAHGRFEVVADLPENLCVGLFAAERTFTAWVRFSSDTVPQTPDLTTTCGIAIKLFGVAGAKLLGDGPTHDFLMQNSDIFFVDNALEMCSFTRAGVIGGDYQPYLDAHPETDRILKEMAKVVDSVLTTPYWSGLPYAFGPDRYVKYKLEPEQLESAQPGDDPNYLALDLASRLRQGEARFRFMVQLQTDPEKMPLDRAMVRWEESDSKPVQVATLILPKQEITDLGQADYGENLAFNPWHCFAEHRPEGTISEVRRQVYAASAKQRHAVNGVSDGEPAEPWNARTIETTSNTEVVSAAIYPAIGVARLGNSEKDFFYGPEVCDPLPESWGSHRDRKGALKRQACRFRIYGLNAKGKAVCELSQSNANIRWKVHLANKKAAWYQFQLALDIPEAGSAIPSMLRNATVSDRSSLIIDPGPRTISGPDQHGDKSYIFDTGKFVGKEVYLGELRTDPKGRLVILGGRGISASFDGSRAVTFANNDAWHDDTSDGPVTAEVIYCGKPVPVKPAWVVVAPPNYAPQQKSVRTMWDLMRDLALSKAMLPAPVRPSFQSDIRPIFERLSGLQWVNKGYANAFGWKGWRNLATPEWLDRLSRNDPTARELRLTITNEFRVFSRDSFAPQPLPWNYGDAMDVPAAQTPRQNTALTDTQLRMLEQWAKGDFKEDYDPKTEPVRSLESLDVADQPDMLDRASMEYCLADAFHPGCEMTWPMRHASMYMGPFRIAHNPENWIEPSFGTELTNDTLLLKNGPLYAQSPGDVTRWMAVPWQTDTASCLSGYDKTYDPYLPTFWPARVPNQVLTHENYEIVMDEQCSIAERMAAFANRSTWLRPPVGDDDYTKQINNMITGFGQLGVVERLPGPGDAEFPAFMEVENLAADTEEPLTADEMSHRVVSARTQIGAYQPDFSNIAKVHRFPHGLRRE